MRKQVWLVLPLIVPMNHHSSPEYHHVFPSAHCSETAGLESFAQLPDKSIMSSLPRISPPVASKQLSYLCICSPWPHNDVLVHETGQSPIIPARKSGKWGEPLPVYPQPHLASWARLHSTDPSSVCWCCRRRRPVLEHPSLRTSPSVKEAGHEILC